MYGLDYIKTAGNAFRYSDVHYTHDGVEDGYRPELEFFEARSEWEVRGSGENAVITRVIPRGVAGTQPGQSVSDLYTFRPVSQSEFESGVREGEPVAGRHAPHNVVKSTDPPENADNGSGLAGVGPDENATETPAGGMVTGDMDPRDAGGDLSNSEPTTQGDNGSLKLLALVGAILAIAAGVLQ
jgi:hypothetical protein